MERLRSIDAAERDPELAEQQARFHREMRGAFITVIERVQQRGELPRNEDPADIVASIFGPPFLSEVVLAGAAGRAVRQELAGAGGGEIAGIPPPRLLPEKSTFILSSVYRAGELTTGSMGVFNLAVKISKK